MYYTPSVYINKYEYKGRLKAIDILETIYASLENNQIDPCDIFNKSIIIISIIAIAKYEM